VGPSRYLTRSSRTSCFKANDDLFRLVREEGIDIGFKDLGGGRVHLRYIGDGSSAGYAWKSTWTDAQGCATSLPRF